MKDKAEPIAATMPEQQVMVRMSVFLDREEVARL
jgi:hypothetical protein